MDRKTIMFTAVAVIAAAVMVGCILALPSDAESQRHIYYVDNSSFNENEVLNVNYMDTIEITSLATYGVNKVDIPGLTFTGEAVYNASGTFTQAGTYVLTKLNINVLSPIPIFTGGTLTINVNYNVDFTASSGGHVNTTSMSIPEGITYTVSGNKITFSNGANVEAISDSHYDFVNWYLNGSELPSGSTGNVDSNMSFSCTFTEHLYHVTLKSYDTHIQMETYTADVPYGTPWKVAGNNFTINGEVVATPTIDTGYKADWCDERYYSVYEGIVEQDSTFLCRSAVFQPRISFIIEGEGNISNYIPLEYGEQYAYKTPAGDRPLLEIYKKSGTAYAWERATAAEGWQFVGFRQADGSYLPLNQKFTLREDIVLTAVFEKIVCNLTFTPMNPDEIHGTIDIAKMDDVPYNTAWHVTDNVLWIGDKAVTAKAADGYVAKWYVNGSLATEGTVTGPMDFQAKFDITYWTVSFTSGTGGHLIIDGDSSKTKIEYIPYGSEITIEDDGSMTIDGHSIVPVSDTGYVFSEFSVMSGSITTNRDIHATFVKSDVNVVLTIKVSEHGKIIVNGVPTDKSTLNIEVPKGIALQVVGGQFNVNGVKYTVQADEGWDFNFWDCPKNATGDTTATAYMINTAISGYVSLIGYDDTVGGKVTAVEFNVEAKVPRGAVFRVDGNTITVGKFVFTADANENFKFTKWTYRNGEEIKDKDVATSDLTLIAVFESTNPQPSGDGNNPVYLALALAAAIAAIALVGMVYRGVRSPMTFILLGVAVVVAVAMILLYAGVIKI